MIDLQYEMTFIERIDGPLEPTVGSPARLCWKIAEASLAGPRITATLAMPGTDWIRVESEGIRRQDLRTQFLTGDGAVVLMHYDTALIRSDERRLFGALESGRETTFADQYMCTSPQFDVSDATLRVAHTEHIHRPWASLRIHADRVRDLPHRLTNPIHVAQKQLWSQPAGGAMPHAVTPN